MHEHEIANEAWIVYMMQPFEERTAVTRQREAALEYFRGQRAKLAADPSATKDDLACLDSCIRFTEEKLGRLPPEEQARRDERRRVQTRARVQKHRAAKQLAEIEARLAG